MHSNPKCLKDKYNNIKIFWSKKNKEPTQDSQNRLWSPMSEWGEP